MHLHNSWIKCKWFAFKGYYHVRWQRSTRRIFVFHIRAHWFASYTYARTQCEIINTHTELPPSPLSSKVYIFFVAFFFSPSVLYSFGSVLKSYHHQHLHGHKMWGTNFAILFLLKCVCVRLLLTHTFDICCWYPFSFGLHDVTFTFVLIGKVSRVTLAAPTGMPLTPILKYDKRKRSAKRFINMQKRNASHFDINSTVNVPPSPSAYKICNVCR